MITLDSTQYEAHINGSDISLVTPSGPMKVLHFEQGYSNLIDEIKKELFYSAKDNGHAISWFSFKLEDMAKEAVDDERIQEYCERNFKQAILTLES